MTKYNLTLVLFIHGLLAWCQPATGTERPYQLWLNEHYFKGLLEQRVQNGRVDIVNETYAVEVEFARNWKHSIGQALWYGMQTNRQPGIVLIMQKIEERKYGIMLQSALNYAAIGDRIKVWFYPEDFGQGFETMPLTSESRNGLSTGGNQNASLSYSINTTSNVRHNNRCAYFNCKNCVQAGPRDGRACGKCGG